MSQHLIFRPRALYIDHPPGSEVAGGDVDLSIKLGVLRVGFGFERCVVSGDTHWQFWTPFAFLACGEKYVQDQHVSSTLLWGNHTRSNGIKAEAEKETAQRQRKYKLWLSSCCQGQRQSEAVLGLGSNVGWVIVVIEMWQGPLKYSITQVFKRF